MKRYILFACLVSALFVGACSGSNPTAPSAPATPTPAPAAPPSTDSAPAVTLAGLSVNPTSVNGGADVQGIVTLSTTAGPAGAVVTLSSGAPSAATPPASVTVPPGTTSATFAIATKVVSSAVAVVLSGSLGDGTRSATLMVMPAASPSAPAPSAPSAALASVALNPTSTTGGSGSVTGSVSLTAPAGSSGVVVALASSSSSAASVPATVAVVTGASNATFPVTTRPVGSSTPVIITATLAGVAKSATLTVAPLPSLANLSLDASTIYSGGAVTGTVALSGAAPAGGFAVAVTANNGASVPGSVIVPQGATRATFSVQTTTTPAVTPSVVHIVATDSSSQPSIAKSADLSVTDPIFVSLVATPPSVIAGNPITVRISLSATPAPSHPVSVTVTYGTFAGSLGILLNTSTYDATVFTGASTPRQVTVTVLIGGVVKSVVVFVCPRVECLVN